MSDQHFTNIFNINGNGNTVNFEQHIDAGSDGAEMMGMVLKFLLTLLLSPFMISFLMTVNGYKMLQDQRGGDYGDE